MVLTLAVHKDVGRFNWHSEIFADGAGYYAYLPVTFLYHFDYNRFPAGIDDSTGCGFIDHQQRKFIYKYTCGVAVMLSPFFAGTLLYSGIFGIPPEGGFSMAFHRMADVAAAFYLVLGLFFIERVLRRHTGSPLRYFLLLLIFAGTNLFFYTVRLPLMSHVYSFCVIAAYLWALQVFTEKEDWRSFILVAVTASLAMLVRPVNGIILLLLPFWNTGTAEAVGQRVRRLLAWRNAVSFAAVFLVIFLPQMLYWVYMFGSPLHYAYEGETFSNWANPRLAEIWFAPLNGLFLYNPGWVLFILGAVLMIIRKQKNGILLLIFFLLASYIISAWHSWFFGCGFGHRAFIDFIPLFAIAFGILAEQVFRIRTRIPGIAFLLLLAAMSGYNIRMTYAYSGCFSGSVWDWDQFSRIASRAGFCRTPSLPFKFTNDFENGTLSPGSYHSDSISRSYLKSIRFNATFSEGAGTPLWFFEFPLPFPTHADARVYVHAPGGTGGAMLTCRISRQGQTLFADSCSVDPFLQTGIAWNKVYRVFTFPADMPWDATILVQIENPAGRVFFADDLKVVYY